MKREPYAVATQLPVPLAALTTQPDTALIEAGKPARPVLEVLVYSPGPVLCRCGRYFSEDFEGRLFCRCCEVTDPSDITARLPLCHRAH
jgi:hypothetical protein